MTEFYYIQVPRHVRPVMHDVKFQSITDFLKDEAACRDTWDLITRYFRTRSKFLSIWPCVRYVTFYRKADDLVALLLVSASLNWQIDYVLVRDDFRHQGIATSLIHHTLNQALVARVPYVMLTSKESLRPLYEGECGFRVIDSSDPLITAERPDQEHLRTMVYSRT